MRTVVAPLATARRSDAESARRTPCRISRMPATVSSTPTRSNGSSAAPNGAMSASNAPLATTSGSAARAGGRWPGWNSREGFRGTLSVIGEQTLQIRVSARFQQRQSQEHARLLWIQVQRGDQAELVVFHFDVPADTPDGDARRANAGDAVLRMLCEGIHCRPGHVAVANAGNDDALGSGGDGRVN